MGTTHHRQWARCLPSLAWKRPGLPQEWVRVLAQHPEGIRALPDYVWVKYGGRALHVMARELEFTDTPPELLKGVHPLGLGAMPGLPPPPVGGAERA